MLYPGGWLHIAPPLQFGIAQHAGPGDEGQKTHTPLWLCILQIPYDQ